jgi:hypothetical protein
VALQTAEWPLAGLAGPKHDAVRRADLADVASFITNWEFGEEVF